MLKRLALIKIIAIWIYYFWQKLDFVAIKDRLFGGKKIINLILDFWLHFENTLRLSIERNKW